MLLSGLRKARTAYLLPTVTARPDFRPFSTTQLRSKAGKPKRKDGPVNFFEQVKDASGTNLFVRATEGPPDLSQKLRSIKARIDDLDASIASDSDFLSKLDPTQRKFLDELFGFEGLGDENNLLATEDWAKKELGRANKAPVLLKIPVPKRQRPYLENFNRALAEAQTEDATVKTSKELWRWYTRSKSNLPPFLHLVPDPVWQVLWTALMARSPSSPDQWLHVKILAKDMLAAGQVLSPKQKVQYIQSLSETGQKDEAVEKWGQEVVTIGMDSKEFQKFWALGVDIFADRGDPEKAEQTAHMLLGSKGGKDIRVLLPVIKSWIRKRESHGYRRAWALYLQLKDKLGQKITMDDYDSISMEFLKSGNRDLGLAVFKDMMLTGDSENPDSLALYKQSMNIVGNVQALSVDAADAENLSLKLMSTLPRKFQNKFFFGSWMKKLLGMGEMEAAASVADLMWQRKLQPPAKYINGLLGAWFRTEGSDSHQKAEQMALEMISNRIKFVEERRSSQASNTGEALDPKSSHALTKLPPASGETFCVLLDFYALQHRHSDAEALRQQLYRCEYNPTAEFMNLFLFSAVRSSGIKEVWNRYKEFTSTSGPWNTQPNMLTFQCLWDCMALKLDPSRKGSKDDFPIDCRQLFAEMLAWWENPKHKASRQRKHHMTQKLFNDIIRCFVLGLSEDYAGCVVALKVMPGLFGYYPNQDTVQSVLSKVAQSEDDEDEARRLSRARPGGEQAGSSRRERKAKFQQASDILEEIQESRAQYLSSTGIDLRKMPQEQLGKERVVLLTEFLRVILSQMVRNPARVDYEIKKASWDMDAPGADSADPHST